MEELRELRASYELEIREYEELMDIRIRLDQEIATYSVRPGDCHLPCPAARKGKQVGIV